LIRSYWRVRSGRRGETRLPEHWSARSMPWMLIVLVPRWATLRGTHRISLKSSLPEQSTMAGQRSSCLRKEAVLGSASPVRLAPVPEDYAHTKHCDAPSVCVACPAWSGWSACYPSLQDSSSKWNPEQILTSPQAPPCTYSATRHSTKAPTRYTSTRAALPSHPSPPPLRSRVDLRGAIATPPRHA
jgi:hypothetical protein